MNAGRLAEGLPALNVPASFWSLTPAEQLFVLADQERVSRGLPPILGLSSVLDQEAAAGIANSTDPTLTSVPAGTTMVAWAANWAEAQTLTLAQFLWMYDDGPGSGNIDCQSAGDPGCWGHRNNILGLTSLVDSRGGNLIMGAATNGSQEAELIYLGTGPLPPLYYSWAEARAAGLG
jgi:hypothetical protein